MKRFENRIEAGRSLADALHEYAHRKDVVVLGLPRGGVVPAFEVAKKLELPLDIIVVRKIGAPDDPELALGAFSEDGVVFFNTDVMHMLGLRRVDLQDAIDAKVQEVEDRRQLFRKGRMPLDLKGKTALIIDDGVATGATIRAAVMSAKKRGAAKVVVGLPVAPIEFKETISSDVDALCILNQPQTFQGVGYFYDDFLQVEDADVLKLLHLS